MPKLQGKTAVITGGSRGIGLATAKAFCREGANVVIFGRGKEDLDAALAEIGGDAIAVQGDVTRTPDLDRLVQTVVDRRLKADGGRIQSPARRTALCLDSRIQGTQGLEICQKQKNTG